MIANETVSLVDQEPAPDNAGGGMEKSKRLLSMQHHVSPLPKQVDPLARVNGQTKQQLSEGAMSGMVRGVCVIAVLIAIWQLCVWLFEPRAFLVPAPMDVARVFAEQPGYLASNALITINEMVLGLIIGSIAGILVALVLSQFALLDRYLMPVVVATQTLPVFAIAPVLVIWFGFGIGSKIVMASLIIFFPVASSFYDGLKQTPRTWLDLGKSWGADNGQMLRFMRIPAAMPSLMSGLKVAATIAPIGAIVGEWAGAAGGLGFVMLQANARVQTDVVFAALIVLAVCAFCLRSLVVVLADRSLWWTGKQV